MRFLLLVVALVGCRSSDDDFPITTGGGGFGGGGGGADAAVDSSDGGANLVGRVCVISNPQLPTTGCATTGAGGLLVTLALHTATTLDDGSFAIEATSGTGIVWTVTGNTIIQTVMPLTASTIIPAVLAVPFGDLEFQNGIVPSPGNGAVFVQVLQSSTPVAGATAIASNQPQYQTLYDPPSGLIWTSNATGALGTAWLPGVLAGTQSVTVQPPLSAAQLTISNVPIIEGALTFITAEVL